MHPGASRFRLGVLGIALGLYDFVLAAGAEKMTSASTAEVTAGLATAGDEETEMRSGLTFPGCVWRHHARAHGSPWDDPRAGRARVGEESWPGRRESQGAVPKAGDGSTRCSRSRLIADPLRLFDCPPISDGAAAIVLCPADRARDFHRRPVRVLGTGHATGPATLWEMDDITTFPGDRSGRSRGVRDGRCHPG